MVGIHVQNTTMVYNAMHFLGIFQMQFQKTMRNDILGIFQIKIYILCISQDFWRYTLTMACISWIYSIYNDSARHRYQDICPPIFQIVMKNVIKISLIIFKECREEILIKLAIILKISKSS